MPVRGRVLPALRCCRKGARQGGGRSSAGFRGHLSVAHGHYDQSGWVEGSRRWYATTAPPLPSATIGGSRKRRCGGGCFAFPTSLSPFPLPAMAASANTRQAKGRPSTGSAGDQGADYDLPGDQTSGRGGALPLRAPAQHHPRKCVLFTPWSRCEGRVAPGGCPHHTPPHRARVALPSRDSDACAPLKRRASLLFSLTHPPSRDSRTVQDP